MRTFDFAPLYRSTVGFDQLFDLLDTGSARPDWPPYDIERQGENQYKISMAIAGFGPEEIELTQHGSTLLVSGQRAAAERGRKFLHQGIASRAFKQSFNLADYVKVVGATLANGLLSVDLVREIPEQMKPRRNEIGGSGDGQVDRNHQLARTEIDIERQAA